MKKLTFTLFLLLASLLIAAQQVPRDKVILEIATGTWCQYCPGAAMGADDLIENGCEVAVIEYHNNDNFDNDASNARNSYYNVGGFPTAHFDGIVTYVGGDQFVSMYSNYLPLYQGRIAIESSFTMQIYGDNSGDDYTIGVMVTKVADGPDVVTLQLALTESNIVFSWMGQDHVNFVERLMAPDAQGTELDFSNTDEIYTELTFTKDASWVLNNCELVSFLQDESDKEIQQGTKVALNNLQPLVATARFVADNTLPCVTTNVNYTDESLGQIISWNWTFEGGNPPASTLQNPVVSYNTPGFYDAQLIVYDGTVYDTLLSVNYIEAITVPSTPNTPSGPTELCQSDGSVVYSTNSLPHTTSYLWTVTPSNAGTIFGTGTQGTFTLAQGYVGTFDIKVRADNQCGYGTFSEALSAQSFYTPVQYTLSDGGGYCEGDPGIDVTQDGSETSVNYELFVGGVSTGEVLPGTGEPLDFGYQATQGIYTCLATGDHCTVGMVGNTYIYVIQQPGTPGTPGGSAVQCNYFTGTEYNTSGAPHAANYNWFLNPVEAGVINGSTTTATVDWNPNYAGVASITVQGVNSCSEGPVSSPLDVNVYAAPAPEVEGEADVCEYDQGVLYNTPLTEGNTYEWQISGGTIVGGAGTHEITVNWGAPGAGSIIVTETSAEACSFTTPEYAVTIEDCTGIGELSNSSFSIYPNPVRDLLTIQIGLQKDQNYNIVMLNQLGQQVWQMTGISGVGSKNLQVNTSAFKAGVYTVRLLNDNGASTEKKIVIID